MKRRLALSILLTVWSMLLIGGVISYFGARAILINDLDTLLYSRVCALPELWHGPHETSRIPPYDWRDSYTIEPRADSTARSQSTPTTPPVILAASFLDGGEGGGRQRVLSVAAHAVATEGAPPLPVTVKYIGSAERVDRLLSRMRAWFFGFGGLVGAAAAGVAFWVSSIVLRPLKSTVQLIGAIDEQNLGARISAERLPRELVPISDGVNEMLSRLQRAFGGHRQFLANVAHDLHRPVVALASRLHELEQQMQDDERARHFARDLNTQVAALRTLIDRLAECGGDIGPEENPVATDIVELVRIVADEVEGLAASRQVTIKRSGPTVLRCAIAASRTRRALKNLLEFAIDESRAGGDVELAFFHDRRSLHVRVTDDGRSLPATTLPHLFTTASPTSRSPDDAIADRGLTLFIVQSHLRTMKGTCRVHTIPGEGNTFVLEIPCEIVFDDGLMDPSQFDDASVGAA